MAENEEAQMTNDPRASERARREEALAHRGEVVAESGEPVEPRRIPQMVSLRLDPETLAALRQLASQRKVTVSELLREGAEQVLASSMSVPVFWESLRIETSRLNATAYVSQSTTIGGFARSKDELAETA